MTIWKFFLLCRRNQNVFMPAGAKLLAVQIQHGAPMLWALVDEDAPRVARSFLTFGTGHAGVRGSYVGTYQLEDSPLGTLVWHVFEVPIEKAHADGIEETT